ncbi:MAG TPA: DUF4340 domain-containing protein [Candidatus Polarisedimenticolaceae bacterium]|nr:DUF4340 domain-containing protein [Candidatus Polarisedimenticolaceae bacterium]
MSLRALAVLLLLLVAAVAAVWWLPEKQEPAKDAGSEEELLVALAASDVGAIELIRGTQHLRLERRAGLGWVLTQPALAEARSEAAEALLRGVLDARVRRVLEPRLPEEAAATYGLAPPEAVVVLHPGKAGAPVRLRLGGGSPVSADRYAQDDRGRLLLVDASLASSLDTSADNLLERRLVPVPARDIAAIAVQRPGGEIRLQRVDGGWTMLAPVVDEADAGDADAWARLLSGMERSRGLRESEETRARALLERPQVRVTVTLAGGKALPALALASEGPLGAKDDPERYAARAARLPGAAPVEGPVPASAVTDLLRPASDLRDPRVAGFDVPEAREVRIRQGGHELALLRSGDGGWTAREDGRPAAVPEAGAVAAWLDRVRLLHASDFAPAGAPFTPARTVVVTLASGKTLTVELGEAAGERVPVRGSRRPAVVAWVSREAVPPWPLRVADLETAAGA